MLGDNFRTLTVSMLYAIREGMVYHFGIMRLLAFIKEFQSEHLFVWY